MLRCIFNKKTYSYINIKINFFYLYYFNGKKYVMRVLTPEMGETTGLLKKED